MLHANPTNVFPALAALRAVAYDNAHGNALKGEAPPAVLPFITISRQAGAGGRTVARQLAARLNEMNVGGLPWTAWDNELVERVVAEHHVPAVEVDAMEDERPSWLEECIGGIALSDAGSYPDEFKVYHAVAATIRSLAEMGRVIVVGRGGAFITGDLPGGLHLRLVAPLEVRVETMARQLGVSSRAATSVVLERDENRQAFYRRHWPSRRLGPESFTATFNTAAVPPEQIVDCVLPLLTVAAVRSRALRPCIADRRVVRPPAGASS